MSDVVIFYDPIFEDHETGYGHPERPERLPAALEMMRETGLIPQVEVVTPRPTSPEIISMVHTEDYVEKVRKMAEVGGGHLDMDTTLSSDSYAAALKAAGALVDSVEGSMGGKFKRAFCLVRPPGHHALPSRGMGFCLFNNVAIAAQYALENSGVEKVMIVDWDAHHGNGTQDIFYRDNRVLYVSLHQYPHYPGTGWVTEIGTSLGEGLTVNVPFPAGTGEEQYLEAFDRLILPLGRKFGPDLLMISAGYDGHHRDLLCSMKLVAGSYAKMTRRLMELAEGLCEGRVVATLEGGYNLQGQARSIARTVAEFAGINLDRMPDEEDPEPSTYVEKAKTVIQEATDLHKPFWKL